MARKFYTPEQIINKLREAEVYLGQSNSIGEASRKIGVTEQTYYRWRREYGGMRVEQARRLKELEKEDAQLKKLVAAAKLVLARTLHLMGRRHRRQCKTCFSLHHQAGNCP